MRIWRSVLRVDVESEKWWIFDFLNFFSNWTQMIKYDVLGTSRCSTSLSGGNQVDGLPPVPSWSPGRKRTQTWFLMTFFIQTQKLNIRLASPIFSLNKHVFRTHHLKDFQICRQNFEKRSDEGLSMFWGLNLSRNITTEIFNQTYNIYPRLEPQKQGASYDAKKSTTYCCRLL